MDPAPVLIVGQGLAGSLLGWACERLAVPFLILDRGHATAASRVGAGVINPLAGQRLVPTWRIVEWRTPAIQMYRDLESQLHLSLVTELRIRRRFRDPAERIRLQPRLEHPDVVPWLVHVDHRGFEVRGGVRVEMGRLLAALRARWRDRGRLIETEVPVEPGRVEDVPAELKRDLRSRSGAHGTDPVERVVWCTGGDLAARVPAIPWQRAAGEVLRGTAPATIPPGELWSDGCWAFADEAAGGICVGATYQRGLAEARPTEEGRMALQAAARRLVGCELEILRHEAGWRVTTPDRRPVAGWLGGDRRRGVLAGLGSKGTLWAPVLAQQWAEVLAGLRPDLEPDVAVSRF